MSIINRKCSKIKEADGFTLIELLVAMAVASIIMAVIAASFWAQTQTSRAQQLVVDMQQNLRSVTYFLERDIMRAGYDLDPNSNPSATINIATPQIFSFDYIDDDNNTVTITYDLYDANSDGDMDIGRIETGSGPKAAIAENIEELEFFYTLADGTQSTDPVMVLGANPDDIRSVGISILARSATETNERDTQTYQSLSGAIVGPYNDGFRRQILTATIKCRNMG